MVGNVQLTGPPKMLKYWKSVLLGQVMNDLPIFCPYTTLKPATAIALKRYDVTYVRMVEENSYRSYFHNRWDEATGFVNIEHDVVPWPGAIDSLQMCRGDWCLFTYDTDQLIGDIGAFIGLVKFTKRFIETVPNVWGDLVTSGWTYNNSAWNGLDLWLWDYMRRREFPINPHQHYPPVVNANDRDLPKDLAEVP